MTMVTVLSEDHNDSLTSYRDGIRLAVRGNHG